MVGEHEKGEGAGLEEELDQGRVERDTLLCHPVYVFGGGFEVGEEVGRSPRILWAEVRWCGMWGITRGRAR